MRSLLTISVLLLALTVMGGRDANAAMRDCYFTRAGDFVCVKSGSSPYKNLPSDIDKKDILPRVVVPEQPPRQKPFIPPESLAQDMNLIYTWPEGADCLEEGELDYKDLLKAAMATNPGLKEDVAHGDMPKFICTRVLPEPEQQDLPHKR